MHAACIHRIRVETEAESTVRPTVNGVTTKQKSTPQRTVPHPTHVDEKVLCTHTSPHFTYTQTHTHARTATHIYGEKLTRCRHRAGRPGESGASLSTSAATRTAGGRAGRTPPGFSTPPRGFPQLRPPRAPTGACKKNLSQHEVSCDGRQDTPR